jgi:glycerol kinase
MAEFASVACQIVDRAGVMDADLGQPLAAIRPTEGSAVPEMLMQTQADLVQIPVAVHASPDDAAMGVGGLAVFGAGANIKMATTLAPFAPSATYASEISSDGTLEFHDAIGALLIESLP